MAPFPHCLGPVGSALPACPLKGLSLLSSFSNLAQHLCRGGTRGGWHPSTRMICRHREGVYVLGTYGQLSAGKDSHDPYPTRRNPLCACWGAGGKTSGQPQKRKWTETLRLRGTPREVAPVENQSSQGQMVRKRHCQGRRGGQPCPVIRKSINTISVL